MATRTISTKLAIEGEAQYKQSVAACNAELKTLKSSLALTESEFRNNANGMEALRAKGSALESLYAAQRGKISELEDALKNAQRAQEEYASRVSTAQENIERCEKALQALQGSTEDTSEEQAALTQELDKWNAELAEAESYQNAAAKGVQNWQKQLNDAQVELNGLTDEIEENNKYLDEAKTSADGCATSIDQFGNKTKNSKQAIDQLAQALAAAGVAKAVKEIADALLDCVDACASFESQMSTVQAISGASGDELTALEEKAKYMGATTAFTATQAAEAFEYMAMAGWKTNDMLGGLEGLMYLAAASGEDLAATSDIVTDALTAFGLSASDSSHFADVLAAASSNANTNVGMMGETFKYAAPVAGALGYSIEDTALAIGLMANAGIKSSQAGTSLRGMLTNLAKPSDTVAMYMERLGVSLTDNEGNVRSLSNLISLLRDRFSELTQAQQSEYAAGIAGKDAMSGLLAIVNASEADYQKLTVAIDECSGAAYNMSQIKLDNYAGKVTLLESAIDGLKIAVGEQLTPALGILADAGANAFTWATDFVNENPWIVGVITGLTTALGALAIGVAGLAAAPAIIGALNTALNLLATNHIVAVGAAIAGLVVAIGTIAASSDEAENSLRGLKKAIEDAKDSYNEVTDSIQKESDNVTALAATLANLMETENKNAGQKAAILELVDQLNEAVPDLSLSYDELGDSLNLTTDEIRAMAQAMARQKQYQADVEYLSQLYLEQTDIIQRKTAAEERLAEIRERLENSDYKDNLYFTEDWRNQILDLEQEISCLDELLSENEQAIQVASEATENFRDKQKEIPPAVEDSQGSIEGLSKTVEELKQQYQEAAEEARKNIESQIDYFGDLDESAGISVQNMIESLKKQAAYMDEYSANIQKAMELGVDKGIIKKLSDGSEESARILAAIVEGGGEDIHALNEQFAKVEEGKDNFAKTVAEMETDFDAEMATIESRHDGMLNHLNGYDAAYQAGKNTVDGYIAGSESQISALERQYQKAARRANAAFKNTLDIHSPSRVFAQDGLYTIQGVIQGAEAGQQDLEDAYAKLAQAAVTAYERSLPAAIETPQVASITETAAIQQAVREMRQFAAGVSSTATGGGLGGMAPDTLVEAICRAMHGMSVYFNGRRLGSLIREQECNTVRARGYNPAPV